MTQLLVSVRSGDEAWCALGGGAAIIDIKEPANGPLGAASDEAIDTIVRCVAGKAPISVAAGELLDHVAWPHLPTAVGWAKLGLAGCAAVDNWPERWQRAIESLSPHVAPVAVAYADHERAAAPAPRAVLERGIALGCRALLIDTFDKLSGGLFAHLRARRVEELIEQARHAGLTTVLAGSLRLGDLDQACELMPDYVAVRGAVCRGLRTGELDEQLVRDWAARLADRCASRPTARAAEWQATVRA